MNMKEKLNEIAERIWEHVEAGGGILDEDDHDRMMATIEHGADLARDSEDDDLWVAVTGARRAMQAWNDEEYPYLEDVIHDMYTEGIDDGDDLYDEE